MGSGEHVDMGLAGVQRGTEFEPWRRLAPFVAEKSWPLLRMVVVVLEVEVARDKSRVTAP